MSSHQAELQYFVDCIQNGTSPEIVTIESAYDTMKLYDDLLKNCTEV
ncbi:MAG: hypothetical protein IJC78_02500 [Clostridia bacterium]|nr:hypothetical protein [Clostridia bacterium]